MGSTVGDLDITVQIPPTSPSRRDYGIRSPARSPTTAHFDNASPPLSPWLPRDLSPASREAEAFRRYESQPPPLVLDQAGYYSGPLPAAPERSTLPSFSGPLPGSTQGFEFSTWARIYHRQHANDNSNSPEVGSSGESSFRKECEDTDRANEESTSTFYLPASPAPHFSARAGMHGRVGSVSGELGRSEDVATQKALVVRGYKSGEIDIGAAYAEDLVRQQRWESLSKDANPKCEEEPMVTIPFKWEEGSSRSLRSSKLGAQIGDFSFGSNQTSAGKTEGSEATVSVSLRPVKTSAPPVKSASASKKAAVVVRSAVPFKWEDVPGKPKLEDHRHSKSTVEKTPALQLPPRLASASVKRTSWTTSTPSLTSRSLSSRSNSSVATARTRPGKTQSLEYTSAKSLRQSQSKPSRQPSQAPSPSPLPSSSPSPQPSPQPPSSPQPSPSPLPSSSLQQSSSPQLSSSPVPSSSPQQSSSPQLSSSPVHSSSPQQSSSPQLSSSPVPSSSPQPSPSRQTLSSPRPSPSLQPPLLSSQDVSKPRHALGPSFLSGPLDNAAKPTTALPATASRSGPISQQGFPQHDFFSIRSPTSTLQGPESISSDGHSHASENCSRKSPSVTYSHSGTSAESLEHWSDADHHHHAFESQGSGHGHGHELLLRQRLPSSKSKPPMSPIHHSPTSADCDKSLGCSDPPTRLPYKMPEMNMCQDIVLAKTQAFSPVSRRGRSNSRCFEMPKFLSKSGGHGDLYSPALDVPSRAMEEGYRSPTYKATLELLSPAPSPAPATTSKARSAKLGSASPRHFVEGFRNSLKQSFYKISKRNGGKSNATSKENPFLMRHPSLAL